jgi:environmental stress-induced protein Ves
MLSIIRSTDYPSRPWKNGGGTTRNILVSPARASLDDFDWRLSLAQVDRDGPFSRFDNVDRTLVLLSGTMTLHEPGRRIELVPGEPVQFPGERAVAATVSGGSTLDFNVMTRRGRAIHRVTNSLFGERVTMDVTARSSVFRIAILLFALDSGLTIDDERLGVHDTAVITEQTVVVGASTGRAAALVVRIVDFRPNVL